MSASLAELGEISKAYAYEQIGKAGGPVVRLSRSARAAQAARSNQAARASYGGGAGVTHAAAKKKTIPLTAGVGVRSTAPSARAARGVAIGPPVAPRPQSLPTAAAEEVKGRPKWLVPAAAGGGALVVGGGGYGAYRASRR